MKQLRFLIGCVCALGIAVSTLPAMADQSIFVDFSEAQLSLTDDAGVVIFSTAVVLPGRDFYSLPVTGVVTNAQMGPSWSPTANTRAAHPGKYKASYGPYEKGNAMGHCKISIDFASSEPILQSVRIHGNAKTDDLGERRSRGCIRIPDDVCGQLIGLVDDYRGNTNVLFSP